MTVSINKYKSQTVILIPVKAPNIAKSRMLKSINTYFSRFSHIGGILCIVGGMLVYMTQNVAFKWFSAEYPLYEVLLIRGVVAVIFILVIFFPFYYCFIFPLLLFLYSFGSASFFFL